MGRDINVSAEDGLTFSRKAGVDLVVSIDSETAGRLDGLARAIGGDRADVFQRALSLLSVAVTAQREGKHVAIVDDDGRVTTEITGVHVGAK